MTTEWMVDSLKANNLLNAEEEFKSKVCLF